MMKQSNKKLYIISAASIFIYAWLLGVCGLYGDTVAHVVRCISLYVLMYGGSAFGAIIIAVLPFKIAQAIERNRLAEEAAIEHARFEAKQREDALKLAIAKKVEEARSYE